MKKVAVRVFTVLFALVLSALLFVYFSPDYSFYIVRSESMKPAINMGDVVVTGPVGGPFNGEIGPGKVITFQSGDVLVTHRILSIKDGTLVTKGDAVEDPDARTVSMSVVRGVYLFKIPGLGYVSNFTRTRTGWLLLIVIPASVLVGFLIRSVRRELRKNAEKNRESKGVI